MLTGALALLVFVTWLWPRTAVGMALHRVLVERPLELSQRVERRHIVLLLVLLFGGQLVLLLGPELAIVYALDVSLYAEAVVATTLAATVARLRVAWRFVADGALTCLRVPGRMFRRIVPADVGAS